MLIFAVQLQLGQILRVQFGQNQEENRTRCRFGPSFYPVIAKLFAFFECRVQTAAVVAKEFLPDDVRRFVPAWRGVAWGKVQLPQQFSFVSE